MNSPAPWYVADKLGSYSILDVTGHKVCTLSYQDDPEAFESNAKCIKMAPQLLISLRMAVHALREDGTHTDLVRHLQRYVDDATHVPYYSDILAEKGVA